MPKHFQKVLLSLFLTQNALALDVLKVSPLEDQRWLQSLAQPAGKSFQYRQAKATLALARARQIIEQSYRAFNRNEEAANYIVSILPEFPLYQLSIKEIFAKKLTFSFPESCHNKNAAAIYDWSEGSTIMICPLFHDNLQSIDGAAQTLIHEMTHQVQASIVHGNQYDVSTREKLISDDKYVEREASEISNAMLTLAELPATPDDYSLNESYETHYPEMIQKIFDGMAFTTASSEMKSIKRVSFTADLVKFIQQKMQTDDYTKFGGIKFYVPFGTARLRIYLNEEVMQKIDPTQDLVFEINDSTYFPDSGNEKKPISSVRLYMKENSPINSVSIDEYRKQPITFKMIENGMNQKVKFLRY